MMTRTKQRRLFVIGALVIGLIATAVAVGLIVTVGQRADETRPSPTGTTERRVSIGSLEIGTCIDEDFQDAEVSEFALAVVDCSEPHLAQVFHIAQLEAAFPGDDEVDRLATAACESAFETWIGSPPQRSTLQFFFYAPTKESWPQGHEVWCIAVAPQDFSGTFEDSGL